MSDHDLGSWWTPARRALYGRAPKPTPNQHPPIHDLVALDLMKRKAHGTRKYGTPLQPHNGRNALQDLYEELLDACAYLKQRLREEEDWRAAHGQMEGRTR